MPVTNPLAYYEHTPVKKKIELKHGEGVLKFLTGIMFWQVFVPYRPFQLSLMFEKP
jgi:hypothetical protein